MFYIRGLISLTLATAGVSMAVVGVSAGSAQALIIAKEFRVDMTSGSLTGQSFFGSFSYDNAALTDPSLQIFDPFNGNLLINEMNGLLSLSFNFLGDIYTQADDAGFPLFPQLNFSEGLFQGLDFIVTENPFAPNPRVIPGSTFEFGTGYNPIDGSFFVAFAGDPDSLDRSFGTVTYGVPIPTPALLPGLIGMGLAALKKRRDEASKAA
jgi:hypothetical protein